MPLKFAEDEEVALLQPWIDQILDHLEVDVMFISDESYLSDFWTESCGDKAAWAARLGDKLGLEGVTYNDSRLVDLAKRLRKPHLH